MSVDAPALGVSRFAYLPFRRLSLAKPGAALAIGGSLLVVIAIACVVVPIVWGYSPEAIVAVPMLAPSIAHPFGTDELGRDVFVRTLMGGRIDLFVAAFAVTASALIGTLIGIVAAFSGRWVDSALMRVVDAIIAFPFLVLVLAVVLLFGAGTQIGPLPPGLPSLLFAVIVTDWAIYARLARGQALSLRERDFIVAVQLLGHGRSRIITRHLLPNVASTIGAYMVSDAILVVGLTAALPFLGAGIQPPTPEWGAIMVDGSTLLGTAWWITVLPGAVLALTGIALSLIADSLLSRVRVA